jgi:hypothetical protein
MLSAWPSSQTLPQTPPSKFVPFEQKIAWTSAAGFAGITFYLCIACRATRMQPAVTGVSGGSQRARTFNVANAENLAANPAVEICSI